MPMLTNEFINRQFGIQESYQLPERLISLLLSNETEGIFHAFLREEPDLSYDWFTDYFQTEHGDRDKFKQDYTPDCLAEVLAGIMPDGERMADICAGSGGLMIKMWAKGKADFFYCEELSDRVVPLLCFNLMIRNMDAVVLHGDTLTRRYKAVYRISPGEEFSIIETACKTDWGDFDTVVMNPPYSLKWSPPIQDERFDDYGIAPKQRADFAFILHGLSLLKDSGSLSAIVPHGILFRGQKEEQIRKALIKKNLLDYVAGVPTSLFLNTTIPVCLIGLKKRRTEQRVLIVDASQEFDKHGKQNVLNERQIQKLTDVVKRRAETAKYAHLAAFKELEENSFNLNIPRYVDTTDPPEAIDFVGTLEDITKLDAEIHRSMEQLISTLDMLTGFDAEEKRRIKELRDVIEDSEADGYRRFIQRQAHDVSKGNDMDRTGRIVGCGELPEGGRPCPAEECGDPSEEPDGSHISSHGNGRAVSGLLQKNKPGDQLSFFVS